ncbi:MAG: signal peptidase II [Lachnospiraceae bacterium]|nr:signal peptidase II [Lachnospiraceae bacterium]
MERGLNKKAKQIIIDFVLLFLLVFLDQYTKYLAVMNLKNKPAFSIIDGVLEFRYLENVGAAFGMLPNQKFFFVFVAIVFICVIAFVIWKTPVKKKYLSLHLLLTMISAGAIGNMIDRLRLNYVVDFIYVPIVRLFGQPFPIFNVADMVVTVPTAILIILILFVYKEADFEFLSFRQRKYREFK